MSLLVAEKLRNQIVRLDCDNFPPSGKLVLVMCWQENHIGYRDQEGRWRHAVLHKELLDVVGWCALSAKGW